MCSFAGGNRQAGLENDKRPVMNRALLFLRLSGRAVGPTDFTPTYFTPTYFTPTYFTPTYFTGFPALS